MTITLDGHPAWVRNSAALVFGGSKDKINHLGGGLIDARMDVGAKAYSLLAMHAAMLANVQPFLEMSIAIDGDSGGGGSVVNWVQMMNGRQAGSYTGASPPSGFPTITDVAAGTVDVTLSASHADAYGTSVPTNIIRARAQTANSTTEQNAESDPTSATVVRVTNRLRTGALKDDETIYLAIWLGY